MSTSVTLSKDTNSSVPGINLKWAYVGLGAIKEICLIYFKNSSDADIVSKEIPSGCLKYNLPSGFESGQMYSFQLQVVDVTGLMVYSAPFALEAPWFLQAPEIESVSGGDQALTVHLGSTSNVLSASDASVEFILKRADNFVFWIIKAYSSSGVYTLTSDDNSALLNNTSYRVACTFQPADGNARYLAPSPISNSITATPSNIPNIPQSISASSVGTTDYSIRVNWSRPDDFAEWSAGAFTVVIKYVSTMGETAFVRLTEDVVTHTLTDLPASRAYYLSVAYENVNGQGPYLNYVPEVLPTQLAPAPVLYSVADGDQEAVLSWQSGGNGQAPITNYKIYRGNTLIATVLQTVTTYTATGLQNGYEYSFKVVAVNEVGDSPASDVLTSTPYGQMSLVSAIASGKTITVVLQPNGRPIQDCKFVAIPTELIAGAGGMSNVADFFADVPQVQISQALYGNVTIVKTFSTFSSDIALYAVTAHNAINSVQFTSTLA
jgi:hypothetical protein